MNTDDYPMLKRIAPERRAHYLDKADQGEPLTESEAVEFGLPHLAGSRLIPRRGGQWAPEQLNQCFPHKARLALLKTLLKNLIAANAKSGHDTMQLKGSLDNAD